MCVAHISFTCAWRLDLDEIKLGTRIRKHKVNEHGSILHFIYLYLKIEVELPGLVWFDPMWIIHKVQSFVGVFSFWHWSGMSSIDGPINELDTRMGYNVHGHVIWSCRQIKFMNLQVYIKELKKKFPEIRKLGFPHSNAYIILL